MDTQLRSMIGGSNGETYKIDGLVEASVLCLFFVQKLGQGTVDDVQGKVEAIGASINPFLVAQALEALRARGLISYARGQTSDGESVKMYRIRQMIWSAPPEVAHIKDLLPALVATEEAQKIVDALNAGEASGEGGTEKAKRELGYDHYIDCVARFLTLDQLLGSQPKSPELERIVKASKVSAPEECDLRFWRSSDGRAIVIGADAVRGWLRTGLRVAHGAADSVGSYLGVGEIWIVPSKPLTQVGFPIVDQRSGRGMGLTTYECLAPGEEVEIRFRIPTRGFMPPQAFKLWLAGYAMQPLRGISPARGGRFGSLVLTSFEVLGETRRAANMIRAVIDRVPEAARGYYQELLDEAEKGEVDVRRGRGEAKATTTAAAPKKRGRPPKN